MLASLAAGACNTPAEAPVTAPEPAPPAKSSTVTPSALRRAQKMGQVAVNPNYVPASSLKAATGAAGGPAAKAIAPADLKAKLDAKASLWLVDVRDDAERAKAALPAAKVLTPALEGEIDGLDKATVLVFFDHRGGYGAQAAQRFAARGFTAVYYLDGGIDAWSAIDPSVPRYRDP